MIGFEHRQLIYENLFKTTNDKYLLQRCIILYVFAYSEKK